MCSPLVIESVREQLSRRGFLKGVGGTVAAAAMAGSAPALAQQKPLKLAKGFQFRGDCTSGAGSELNDVARTLDRFDQRLAPPAEADDCGVEHAFKPVQARRAA